MENELNDVDINNEEVFESEEKVEEVEEKPKPKKEFTDEEQLAIHQREIKKLSKKLGKEIEKPTISEDKSKSEDLDYGQKAFLRSYDIKGSDELQLAKDWQKRTGDTLDAMVEDEIFIAKLNGLREARASANAIPKGTKRSSSGNAVGEFEMALAKFNDTGELPQSFELRSKVLNHATQNSSANSPFAN